MGKEFEFDQFWDYAIATAKRGHDLEYHACCDSWSTRNCKKARNSHEKTLRWRKILQALGRSEVNQKMALLMKMRDEGWRIPVRLNFRCRIQTKSPRRIEELRIQTDRRPNIQTSLLQHSEQEPVHFDSGWNCHTREISNLRLNRLT